MNLSRFGLVAALLAGVLPVLALELPSGQLTAGTTVEKCYLDLVEVAVGAYDDARMEDYVREAETAGVQEHGFPRLAANLAQLVATGRMVGKKPMLARLMTVACACAKKGKMPPKSGGNEFSVRELVSAVVALEKAGTFPTEKIAAWKRDLAAVEAGRCYTSSSWFKLGEPVGRNWPLFGAASEQARIRYGLGGDRKFIEDWVSDQLRHFDANGMYRDPHEPAVYDFIGRLCYMQILHFGYDGPSRAKIEENLVRSAEPTLAMLSVCGEIPYGGRSNQFLHNNTLYAAVAEWYAAFFAKRGETEKAAEFRAAARRAVDALEPWVEDGKVFHVKNRHPKPEAKGARNMEQKWFGCENYAYFDKYMVTMGSWAALAEEFAGEGRGTQHRCAPVLRRTAREGTRRTEEGSTFTTSDHFHWKFTHSRNYTVQEDWNANAQYDATGVGRIHRRGAPPAICLSAPFAEKPNYFIGTEKNPGPLAIAATGGKMSYEVGDDGVTIRVEGNGNMPTTKSGAVLALPVFEFDGEEETKVAVTPKVVTVAYHGWVCRYEARGGTFAETGLRYLNRNGRYRRIDCTGRAFEVAVTIERESRGSRTCGVASERADDVHTALKKGDGAGTLRPDHPRMFFNAETWPSVKARAEGSARAERDALVVRCRSYTNDPVCTGTERVKFGEVKTATGTIKVTPATPIPPIREFGTEAAECALAWRFTGEKVFLAKAKKMLLANGRGYREAYANGRAVNWWSTTRILSLCAYDWIFEALTSDERRAIVVPLVEHVEEVQPRKGGPFIVRRNTSGIETGFYGVQSLLWYSGLAAGLAALLKESKANPRVAMGSWPMYPFILDQQPPDVKPYSFDELKAAPAKARYFEKLGQFKMRSGWAADSTYASFTAGAAVHSHKHFDENSLWFNRTGRAGGEIEIAGRHRVFATTVQKQSGIVEGWRTKPRACPIGFRRRPSFGLWTRMRTAFPIRGNSCMDLRVKTSLFFKESVRLSDDY